MQVIRLVESFTKKKIVDKYLHMFAPKPPADLTKPSYDGGHAIEQVLVKRSLAGVPIFNDSQESLELKVDETKS